LRGDVVAVLRTQGTRCGRYTGAIRHSEIVGLDVEDLQFTKKGLVALVKKSKTGQEATEIRYKTGRRGNPVWPGVVKLSM
jgi:hypothetical protein